MSDPLSSVAAHFAQQDAEALRQALADARAEAAGLKQQAAELEAYRADAADRFAAVVRQRDAAEAENARLKAAAETERERLKAAIRTHRSQKADDRCIEDDDRLYEALGDGIRCDRSVGSKPEMLANCARFIDRRCEGGGWPSYRELEEERDRLQAFKEWVHAYLDAQGVPHHPPGSHGAEGCRIGDRMDWLMGRLREAKAELDPPGKEPQCPQP